MVNFVKYPYLPLLNPHKDFKFNDFSKYIVYNFLGINKK